MPFKEKQAVLVYQKHKTMGDGRPTKECKNLEEKNPEELKIY